MLGNRNTKDATRALIEAPKLYRRPVAGSNDAHFEFAVIDPTGPYYDTDQETAGYYRNYFDEYASSFFIKSTGAPSKIQRLLTFWSEDYGFWTFAPFRHLERATRWNGVALDGWISPVNENTPLRVDKLFVEARSEKK